MCPSAPTSRDPARGSVAVLLLAATTLLLAAPGCAPDAERRMPALPIPVERVILITVDTLRADHLPCYGYTRETAPFICGLADRGVLFEETITSSSHTAPAHASIFTSLTPVQHKVRVNGESLDPAIRTMAGRFADAGYVTGAFASVGFLRSIAGGFEHVDARSSDFPSVYRPADVTFDAARRWVRRRDVPERLFLWIHLYDVHHWYKPEVVDAEALARLRRDDPGGGRRLAEAQIERDPSALEQFADVAELADVIDRYDAQIAFVDRQLERVYRIMERTGHLDGSLWIVTSDHGEGLGRHGYGGHGRYLYEEQLRVPLIVHAPGRILEPRRVETMVRLVDLYPTLAELLDGASPDRASLSEPIQVIPAAGRSLVGLLRGEPEPVPVPAFVQRRARKPEWGPGELFGLRTPDFKYLHRPDAGDELYDLRTDPLELDNLATEPPAAAAGLRARLLELHERLERQAESIAGGALDPEHLEELRALGYIR